MIKEEIIALLKQHNPYSRFDFIESYAINYLMYKEADENITKNGVICNHPRTGVPFENPYVEVRNKALKCLETNTALIDVSFLWE